jgi:ubiquinone/menaquinone biosynthesis C-methylase UbiE
MSFDRISGFYPAMERWLAGSCMQKARTACLKELREPKNVLLVGEGHGRLLVEIMRLFPSAKMTCLDGSSGMLKKAKETLRRAGISEFRCRFVHADALIWEPPAQDEAFDLITSCFIFDCFPQKELDRLVPHLAQSATPDAEWLIADFQIPHSGVARWRASVILRLLYTFFRLVTGIKASELPQHATLLGDAGFTPSSRRELEFGLLYSELWRRIPAAPAQFKDGSSGIRASSL